MMDARLQIRVQRYGWDAAASHYHAGWEQQLKPAQDTLLRMVDVQPGQSVIETASGSGMVTQRLANAIGPEGRVIATDLSQGMIDDLLNRMDACKVGNVTASRMPAEKLDQPDNAFDSAICALGLMYTPDPAKAVAEMARVVVPGGTVAALVWGERRNCGWAEFFPSSMQGWRLKSARCSSAPVRRTRLFAPLNKPDSKKSRSIVNQKTCVSKTKRP
jgi:ubiquinone/menaquinone biosynthesis C-methylase UbiE